MNWILSILIIAFLTSCLDSRPAKDNASSGSSNTISSDLSIESIGFAQHVRPIVEANCIACHSEAIAPLFVQDDIEAAALSVLTGKKVDFDRLENSRLVKRLTEDRHNCGLESECDEIGAEMLEALNNWKSSLPADFFRKDGIYTVSKSFSQGLPGEVVEIGEQQIEGTTLTFDLSQYFGGKDAQLEIDVYPYEDNTGDLYILRNPRIVTTEANNVDFVFVIKEMKITINGVVVNDGVQGFARIITLVRASDENTHNINPNNRETILPQQNGQDADSFGIYFKVLAEYKDL
jgi:hypothetical protein